MLLSKKNIYHLLIFVFFPILCFAFSYESPLPPEKAFIITFDFKQFNNLSVKWKIAQGYYLYKSRIHFSISNNESTSFKVLKLPKGKIHYDAILGNNEIYENEVTIPLRFYSSSTQKKTLSITYQGCSDKGFCYPPMTKNLRILLEPNSNSKSHTKNIKDLFLNSEYSFLILLGFFLSGILLAFTPCVFPMLPILASIIIGQEPNTRKSKSFALSLTYVLSIAITYASAGIFAGLTGQNLQGILQQPFVLSVFSFILFILALSMFGFYELRLPRVWEEKISTLNQHQKGGKYFSVAIMGCLSALIVSPCVSPPLIAGLSYITQKGNPWFGGISLLLLGLGMGIPMLLIGLFGKRILPKTGSWMESMKTLLGFGLLALIISLLSRILSFYIIEGLWAFLIIFFSISLGALEAAHTLKEKLWKSICVSLLLCGCFLAFNAFQYGLMIKPTDTHTNTKISSKISFEHIQNLTQFKNKLYLAQQEHKKVLLDFYADWCLTCQRMEKTLFTNPEIKSAIANMQRLRIDMTKLTPELQSLIRYFHIIAPPAILLFDKNGNELINNRIIGEINTQDFIKVLNEPNNFLS